MGGGHGHAVRGIAVLDRLARRAPALKTALVAPERHAGWCASKGVALRSPPRGARETAAVASWAESLPAPRLLLSDVFPRGVVGELAGLLPRLERKAWLVSRRVRPGAWLEPPVHRALEDRYDRVFWCEAPPAELRQVEVRQSAVGPVLIERTADCLDAEAARAALALDPQVSVVLMVGAGDEEEQRDTLRLLRKVQARLATGSDPPFELVVLSARLPATHRPGLSVCDLFPAMRVLRAATLVVSGGGYTAWHEARVLGVPGVFLPRPRPWDDQHLRVAETRPPATPEELEAEIDRMLRSPPPPLPVDAADGADQIAATLLREL